MDVSFKQWLLDRFLFLETFHETIFLNNILREKIKNESVNLFVDMQRCDSYIDILNSLIYRLIEVYGARLSLSRNIKFDQKYTFLNQILLISAKKGYFETQLSKAIFDTSRELDFLNKKKPSAAFYCLAKRIEVLPTKTKICFNLLTDKSTEIRRLQHGCDVFLRYGTSDILNSFSKKQVQKEYSIHEFNIEEALLGLYSDG